MSQESPSLLRLLRLRSVRVRSVPVTAGRRSKESRPCTRSGWFHYRHVRSRAWSMSAINPKPNSALHRTPLRTAGELYRAFARKTPFLLRLLRLRSARVRSVLVRAGRMSNDAEPFRDIIASRLEASCLRLARWSGPRYAPCREQYRTGPECGMPGIGKLKVKRHASTALSTRLMQGMVIAPDVRPA